MNYVEGRKYLGENGKVYMYVGKRETYTVSSENTLKITVKAKKAENTFVTDLNGTPRIVGSRIEKNLNGVAFTSTEAERKMVENLLNNSYKTSKLNTTPHMEETYVKADNMLSKDGEIYRFTIKNSGDWTFNSYLNGEKLKNIFNNEKLEALYAKAVKNGALNTLPSNNPFYEVYNEAYKEAKEYLNNNGYKVVNIYYTTENGTERYEAKEFYRD